MTTDELSPDEEALVRFWRSISDEQRRLVLRTLTSFGNGVIRTAIPNEADRDRRQALDEAIHDVGKSDD